jgi:hypothetical protein
LEIIFEFVLEFLGELLFELAAQLLAELGLATLAAPFEKKPNSVLAILAYICFGAALGAVSIAIWPGHIVADPTRRLVNLALTPIAVGLSAAAIQPWRKLATPTIQVFAQAYLFALTLAGVRYFWAA